MHKIKLLLLIFLLLISSVHNIYAIDEIDYSKKGSITITNSDDINHIDLYMIGSYTQDGELIISDDYDHYQLNYDVDHASDIQDLAATLKGIIYQNHIQSIYSKNINQEEVNINDLNSGLYLLLIDKVVKPTYTKEYSPILLNIPEITEEKINYDIIATLKYQDEQIDEISLNIKKIWKNTDNPQDITVSIFKDKELYKEVVLSKENNFLYSEDHLSTKYDYTVMEKTKLDDYQVTISKDQYTYYIINTYTKKGEEPTIPQTGQLWWPVPILLISGLSLYMLGTYMNKEENNNV